LHAVLVSEPKFFSKRPKQIGKGAASLVVSPRDKQFVVSLSQLGDVRREHIVLLLVPLSKVRSYLNLLIYVLMPEEKAFVTIVAGRGERSRLEEADALESAAVLLGAVQGLNVEELDVGGQVLELVVELLLVLIVPAQHVLALHS